MKSKYRLAIPEIHLCQNLVKQDCQTVVPQVLLQKLSSIHHFPQIQ